MKNSILILLPLLLLPAGCIRENFETPDGDMKIRLGAKVDAVIVSTKAALDKEDTYGSDLDINLIRWDADDTDHSSAGREELPATMGRTPSNDGKFYRDITVTPTQFFADRTKEVGFAGWYPAKSDVAGNPGNNWVTRSDSDGNEYVIHPADENHSKPYMTYTIDETTDTDVMISDFVKGNYTNGIPAMEFRHALCKYNIHAYAVSEDIKSEWGKVTSITLTNMPDSVTILLPDDITSGDAVEFKYSKKDHPYTILSPEDEAVDLHPGMPSETSTILIGSILGGAPASGVLGIEARTEKQGAGNSVSIARNFKPGYIYNIFLKFSSKGIINAEVSAMDWEVDDNEYIVDENFDLLTDLSRYGTANSYIVSSANRGYCFTGTVKGNGDVGNSLTGRNGQTIILDDDGVNLNVDHVGIVRSDALMQKVGGTWQRVPDDQRANIKLIELVSDKLSNGRVIFKVPGAMKTNPDGSKEYDNTDFSLQYKGNAKIAAYDASGNIVWAWHIWITDKPINQGYSNGYVALDRNLGAATDTWDGFYGTNTDPNKNIAYTGLYYQWGRKDPFFPAPFIDKNQWEDVDETEHPVYENRRVSVDYAVRHPMTYFFDGTGRSNSWVSEEDNENFDHFWGYVSVRDDIVKTIYDPCPPGYRVPGNPLWEDPSPNMKGWAVYDSPTEDPEKFAGYNFNIDGMIDIYYPYTSCIVSDGQTVSVKKYDFLTDPAESGHNDRFVFMYSATPYEPDLYGSPDESQNYSDLSYHFRYNEQALGTDYKGVMTADPARYHVKRSDAYPVRCVFENSSPTVTDLSEKQTANSYNITASGFYEFDATVRGNGVTKLNLFDKNNQIITRTFDAGLGATINDIERIDVLWWQGDLLPDSHYMDVIAETANLTGDALTEYIDAECPVTVLDGGQLVDGKPLLYIRVNENTYGNAGLAAYDEFGNILWSWHLWLCPGISTVQLGDYTLMDRNLGATYCPEKNTDFNSGNIYAGYGFLYQWGRKDPFFQPAVRSDNGSSSGRNTQVWFKKDASGQWERKTANDITGGQPGSILESIRNPMTFFNANQSSWQSYYEAVSEGSPLQDFWGYVGASGVAGSSFAKTMYDPCPPGYRVIQHDVFRKANVCGDNDGGYSQNQWTWQWSWQDGANYSFSETFAYGIYLDGSESTSLGNIMAGGILFPNTARILSDGNFSNDGKFSLATASPYYSSAAANASDNQIHSREIMWEKSYRNITIYQTPKNWISDGRAVRCQME